MEFDFKNGEVLLINKPFEWTSFDVVNKIRYLIKKRYNIKKIKVGHAGTLDPLATGLMIVCTGKATKKIQDFTNYDKEYIAEIKFGATTPSFDLETEVDKTYPYNHINEKELLNILKNKFIGKINQIPPIFSAKKINGVRAYEYARKGENIELKPSLVEIKSIEILNINLPFVTLLIKCSKGMYVRSLIRDIGFSLKSGAHLTKLERTSVGEFKIENTFTISQFETIINN
ncbi:MAG: tRNA pseudouridine(55) synthase TruB [Chlorobi bacterium]|nr:tRNA pseudouridine(55) synthase TruB [Chlorobiota bacterium]